MSDCDKESPCNFPGCEACGPRLTSVGRDDLLAIIRGLLASCRLMKARLEEPKLPMRRASVVLIENIDGELLVVWNRRFGGWTLPGGKQEPGETPRDAASRELDEECNLLYSPENFELVYEGVNKTQAEDMLVTVFRIADVPDGAMQTERGCPMGWLSAEDVLRWSPFADFYRRARAFDPPKTDSKAPGQPRTPECPP